ncbi:Trk-type K+ transport system, membrane component [Halolactibacillus halophilus]|uniref:Ktr system potassium uptake protein D n=1 Tax=Halolactibacillus halophilus TaxID=306540 RepID=A0A1I5QUC9_9BACI|nr:TrkH family potassium uptake protein [Halolactibacillus halophilus]GEM01923.1 Ktr system potassium uptake protein D [Halolactibacillus halophilus]SFP49740.1 Trk-type K+ transport system, membrane component [Halolactibacillus halophilus]
MALFKIPFKSFKQLSSVQLIVLYYVSAILISTAILLFPPFLMPGVNVSLLDTLFTSISAISVTGLSVVSVSETYNTIGYFAFAFILQFGGIGIMTLGTTIYILLGKKIGIRERQLISVDQNRSTLSGLVQLMLTILRTVIIIEVIGTILLSLRYLAYFDAWQEAWMQGFFAAVSATTNAGFDITGNSLIPFAGDYYVQIINMLLLILGAIGFPVLIELQQWALRGKERRKVFRFSTFTKLTTTTFFLLVIFGAVMIYLIERTHFFQGVSGLEAFFYSLFQSITTRNGGLSTMDVSDFQSPTWMVLSFLMFIGASPSSVGGGVRTTTFAIMLLSIFHYAKGHTNIKVFKREISRQDVLRSFIVITTAFMLCMMAIFVMSITEPFSNTAIAFEVFSAFGTTGLSLGITSDLSVIGKVVIMIMMFVGRIGIFSFLFIIRGKPTKDMYKYPEAKMIIG